MLSEHVRRRLEQLNRSPLPKRDVVDEPQASPGAGWQSESLGEPSAASDTTASQESGPPDVDVIDSAAAQQELRPPDEVVRVLSKLKVYEPAALEDVAPGEVIEGAAGTYYRIDRPLTGVWPQSEAILTAAARRIAELDSSPEPLHDEFAAFVTHFPGGVMFLDLETCGFAGSVVFLVGLLCEVDGELTLRQLLARSYAEEAAMLAALWRETARNPVLATFNGKTFDWPVVHDRSTRHHQGRDMREAKTPTPAPAPFEVLERHDPRPNPVHFDLLHHSRRRWKDRLPNCKLQTLERFLCGRARHGDIPGGEIPAAYHEFVRSGDARQMADILHHNALDLVTLLQVSLQMI